MKIAIFTTTFSLGGITTYTLNLLKYLNEKGYDITLYYSGDQINALEECPKKIKLIKYHQPNIKSFKFIVYAIIKGLLFDLIRIRIRNRSNVSPSKSVQRLTFCEASFTRLKETKYDVVISTSEFYCDYLITTHFKNNKKIVWYHPDMSALDIDIKFEERVLKECSVIAVVSDKCKESFCELFPKYQDKVVVVNPIILTKSIYDKANENDDIVSFDKNELNIITVCRFDNSSKRIDRIVNSCVYLKKNNIRFKWRIVGDGKDKNMIEKLIIDNNISDVMLLVGSKVNPYPYIVNSDVFVLSSQYEGKPIVIEEALALHIPCIVSNYLSASSQLNSKYGAIIDNDDDTFAEQLFKVINSNVISKYKKNLLSYDVNNTNSYLAIDDMIKRCY